MQATARQVVHGDFTITRDYDASPAKVFAAFADPAKKRRWFVEGEGWETKSYEAAFQVGGKEWGVFVFQGAHEVRNDTWYHDIVPNERIVFAYTMTVGGARISASLATVVISPNGQGATLSYTEQGAFFEGAEAIEQREVGCRELFEALAKELAAHP